MKRIDVTRDYSSLKEISEDRIFERLKMQNISAKSFLIQRAEIEVTEADGNEKLVGSIKFKYPDKYLISLRNKTGIEAARIFISDDTILVNDRINRKQYCGSPKYLKNKYGITTKLFPLLFGDYIDDNLLDNSTEKCVNGNLNIVSEIDGIKIEYTIDCIKGKCSMAIGKDSLNTEGIEIKYNDFINVGSNLVPGIIEIKDFHRETTINIAIKKMMLPWDGNVEFVPGKRYKIIELL